MKITTESGFECVIDERKFTDYRFLQKMKKFYSKDEAVQVEGMIDLIPFVLGEEQNDKLTEFCLDEDGYCDVRRVFNVFQEIFDLAQAENQKVKKF